MPPPAHPDSVLLIHGTFAQDRSYWEERRLVRRILRWLRRPTIQEPALPTPESWWRIKSEFAAIVNEAGAGRVGVVEEDRQFHWTGENKESQRLLAGEELADHLQGFEEDYKRDGRKYHLIGHSHGGSVIWNALRASVHRGRPLNGLASWSTVGTPFLRFQPAWRDLWIVLPMALYAILTPWIYRPLGLAFTYYPEVEPQDRAILVVLAALPLLHAVVLGFLGLRLISVVWAAIRDARGRVLDASTWRRFGGLWRGVWSRGDEAISGLAGSLSLAGAVTPRFAGVGTIRVDGWLSAIMAPVRFAYLATVGTFYNALIAPNIDRFIWRSVAAQFHGNDRGGLRMADVWHGPDRAYPADSGLPEPTDLALIAEADHRAAEILREARMALGRAAEGPAGIATLKGLLGGQFASEGLIHTGYFRAPEVRQLLLSWIDGHAAKATAANPLRSGPAAAPPEPIPVPEPATDAPGQGWAGWLAARLRGVRPSYALTIALVLMPLAVSAYASNALRGAMLPYGIGYQVAQIVESRPHVPVANTGTENPEDYEETQRQVSAYSEALRKLGRFEAAVLAAAENGYTVQNRAYQSTPCPLASLLRGRNALDLERAARIAENADDEEVRLSIRLGLAEEWLHLGSRDLAWEAGLRALESAETLSPRAASPWSSRYSQEASQLVALGFSREVFDEIRGSKVGDRRLALLLEFSTSIGLGKDLVLADRDALTDLVITEVLPAWETPNQAGRGAVTNFVPDRLAILLCERARFLDLVRIDEKLASTAVGDEINRIARVYLFDEQFGPKGYPIPDPVVEQCFEACRLVGDRRERGRFWADLARHLLRHGNWPESDRALGLAFADREAVLQEDRKARDLDEQQEQVQQGPATPPRLDPLDKVYFDRFIQSMRVVGRSDEVVNAFEERWRSALEPTVGSPPTIDMEATRESIALRDQLVGYLTYSAGPSPKDVRAIGLATLVAGFQIRDNLRGREWASWAAHEAIEARRSIESERVCAEIDRILSEAPGGLTAISSWIDPEPAPPLRYTEWVIRPPTSDSTPMEWAYQFDSTNMLTDRIALALARAGFAREAVEAVDRIVPDHSIPGLSLAVWNELIPLLDRQIHPSGAPEVIGPVDPVLGEIATRIRRQKVLLGAIGELHRSRGGPSPAPDVEDGIAVEIDQFFTVDPVRTANDPGPVPAGQKPLGKSRVVETSSPWICFWLLSQGRHDEALASARAKPPGGKGVANWDPVMRDEALKALFDDALEAGDLPLASEMAALRVANAGPSPSWEVGASPFATLAVGAAVRGDGVAANAAADAIGDPDERTLVLADLAWRLRQSGRASEAEAALARARAPSSAALAPNQSDEFGLEPDPRPRFLAQLHLARVEDPEPARRFILLVLEEGERGKLEKSATFYGPVGYFSNPVDFDLWVATNLRELSLKTGAATAVAQAEAAIEDLKAEAPRSGALADVAIERAKQGQYRAARLMVAPCLARDKLRAYTAILDQIALEPSTSTGGQLGWSD